jgi:cell division septation protein DedD
MTSSNDDGFREIQLNGKQLVFLFMAVTVVLVVTFLTGVLVGRGVRAERAEAAQADVLDETPVAPPHAAVAPPVGGDPTQAPPPLGAEESADTGKPQETTTAEEPPVAVARSTPPSAAPARTPETARAEKPSPSEPPARKPAVSKPAPAASTPPAAAAAAPSNTSATPRSGYAVQVAAVNARGEADTIVKRLSGKGYAAYIEDPRGSQKMFRVRVGTFKTRSEAQSIAERLKREEKFAPWVTR